MGRYTMRKVFRRIVLGEFRAQTKIQVYDGVGALCPSLSEPSRGGL
jgi:hypothetical protein